MAVMVRRGQSPPLELPVLVMIHQHRYYQAGVGWLCGEDADHTGAAFDFWVDTLKQGGTSDLAPVVLREMPNPLQDLTDYSIIIPLN